MSRGDVVLVRVPHPSGGRGKKRPAVVVQADSYSAVVKTLVVAEVTSNLTLASDPACLFIDATTPEGQATGLTRDSVVSCLALVTVYNDAIDQTLGALSPRAALAARRLSESRPWAAVTFAERHRRSHTSPLIGSPSGSIGIGRPWWSGKLVFW
jgi:mRNA-degrading endonuclease toxin of MazEF toxin-antitoxin module